jgi:uncharacterized damage-inducible protein DinB
MKLSDLYPYWAGAHDELLTTLHALDKERLNYKPVPGTPTIRQLALQLLEDERFWIAHLVAGFDTETPRPADFRTGAALAEALAAQRLITARALEPFGALGLKSVRTVPADALPNRPEANMPVGWLFWHVLERELMAWGQIQQRLEEAKAAEHDADG